MAERWHGDRADDGGATGRAAARTIISGFCIRCGYDIRGLTADAVCPECGALLAMSLRGDLLEYAAPEYVARIRGALTMVLWGVGGQLVLVLLVITAGIFLNVMSSGLGAQFGGRDVMGQVAVLASFISVGFIALVVIGWWRFTAPDAGRAGRDDGRASRAVGRASGCIVVGLYAALAAVQASRSGWSTGIRVGAFEAADVLFLSGIAAAIVWVIATMQYTAWVARRIPSVHSYRRAKEFVWAGPLLATVGSCVCGLGMIVAVVMYWNLVSLLRRELGNVLVRMSLREELR